MAQSGYTPILIYASGTATVVPTAGNLTSSTNGAELALNYADGKLYYKNNSGVVSLLASASASVTTGTSSQLLANNGTGGFSNVTIGSGLLLSGGTLSASGTAGVTSFQTSLNGLTPNIATTGAITLAGILGVASGGTGTSTPSLIAGTNITSITGTWPNQTINAAGGSGGSYTFSAGVGMSVTNVSSTVTYSNTQTPATITTGTVITPTITTSQYNVTALATTTTFAAPAAGVDGQRLTIRIKDNGTRQTISSWVGTSGGYRVVGTTLPTATTATVTYVGCVYNSQDAYWDVLAVGQA